MTAWRTHAVRVSLAGAVLLMLAAGVVGAARAIRDRDERADANSRLDFADREVAWGNGWTLSQTALYAARSAIPRLADYEVVVGDESRFPEPLTHRFAPSYLHFFLMPRHPRSGARWVVCYRCDRAALGGGASVVWEDAEAGIAIVRRQGTGPA